MNEHPDILDLELFRTGEAAEDVGEHVLRCPQCQAELDRLSELSTQLAPADVPVADIAPAVDEAVLAVIGRRTSPRLRLILTVTRWLAPAAAALLVLGGIAVLWWNGPKGTAPGASAYAACDLNRDGSVDILDALAMARGLKAGATSPAWDVNRDGRVDSADVDAVARRAVAIEQEEVEG